MAAELLQPPGARGLARKPSRAYLAPIVKSFFKHISPLRAFADLRRFLGSRKPHEVLFLFPALMLTVLVLVGFYKDSQFDVPYKRNIIYVESWPLNRTDAEIHAQQKIDQAKKHQDQAEFEKQQKKRQQEFKKMDDWLTAHGL